MDSNSLYTIEVLDKGKTLNEVLKEHDMGLSAAIIERVCYAIDNDIKKIDVAVVVTDLCDITLHTSYKDFQNTLEANMNKLIEYEQYEMCAVAKDHIEILKGQKTK
jgi:hypothetical protein